MAHPKTISRRLQAQFMGPPGSAWTRVLGRQKLETTPLLSLSLSSGPSPLGDGRGVLTVGEQH